MKRDFLYIKEVDRLGRICLPIEMRRAYALENGAKVVITPTEDDIILRCLDDAKEQATQPLFEAIMERLNK